MWKGQDYWKPKYSEVAAGNKLKVGTVGGSQQDPEHRTRLKQYRREREDRKEHSGQRKLHVQGP